MKKIPILFSGPMVLAILNGQKMQTRRVYKEKHENKWPYGKFGDILWVRETFQYCDVDVQFENNSRAQVLYKASNDIRPDGISIDEFNCVQWIPVSDEKAGDIQDEIEYMEATHDVYKPSIHMPFDACRIFLAVDRVRIQRLLDISERDALAEGILPYTKDGKLMKYGVEGIDIPWTDMPRTPQEAYFQLWDKINGKDHHKSNPVVWVIDFVVITKEQALQLLSHEK